LSNPWPNCPRLPHGAAAALAALHLSEPRLDALGRLTEREWREALDYCDRARITLALRDAARDAMPQWVRQRVDENAANNLVRLRAAEELYRDLASRLTAAQVGFLALKGMTHPALFGGRPESRVQYDIDLFSPRESLHAAHALLLARGYQPLEGMEDSPTDHLPVLVRKTGWQWRGDFFDPEMPLSVDLHFQFWNGRMERLPAPGTEEFWTRRTRRMIAGTELETLSTSDALAYAALHALKHLLRGTPKASHLHEIACILDSHAAGDALWTEWRALHSPELRRLQAVVFRLALEWFGCRMPPAAQEETERLPAATQAWFADFATSPASSRFDSNKDQLWLHLSLLNSRRDAWGVARLRLLPANLPSLAGAARVSGNGAAWRYVAHVLSRLRHHAISLPRIAAGSSGSSSPPPCCSISRCSSSPCSTICSCSISASARISWGW
jgi:hypothetical protein